MASGTSAAFLVEHVSVPQLLSHTSFGVTSVFSFHVSILLALWITNSKQPLPHRAAWCCLWVSRLSSSLCLLLRGFISVLCRRFWQWQELFGVLQGCLEGGRLPRRGLEGKSTSLEGKQPSINVRPAATWARHLHTLAVLQTKLLKGLEHLRESRKIETHQRPQKLYHYRKKLCM